MIEKPVDWSKDRRARENSPHDAHILTSNQVEEPVADWRLLTSYSYQGLQTTIAGARDGTIQRRCLATASA